MAILDMQKRLTELGRIRLGEKGSKGEPRRLSKIRLTSASRSHLEAAAKVYGGQVRGWAGSPTGDQFELYTDATQVDILIPPTAASYSQYYELWSGGGCQRRCDGQTELLSGEPCKCDPDERACQVTTRVSVMLPKVPGLGVWRLESHGWNAAAKLPGQLEMLALSGRGSFVPAVLRIVQKKEVKGGQTRRWTEPEIDVPEGTTIVDLLTAAQADAMLAGSRAPAPQIEAVNRRERVTRPALPNGPEVPDEPMRRPRPSFGTAPELSSAPMEPPPPDEEMPTGEVRLAPMSAREFSHRANAAGITKTEVQAAHDQLMPGVKSSEMSDEQWAALAHALGIDGEAAA